MKALHKTTYLFKKYFPNKIIYSALGNLFHVIITHCLLIMYKHTLGNHETTPINLYPTTTKYENNDWLYSKLINDWIKTGLPHRLRQKILK